MPSVAQNLRVQYDLDKPVSAHAWGQGRSRQVRYLFAIADAGVDR
jgi:hypothetical protein